MEDSAIIDLYLNREESAIGETEKKYSNYLTKIAFNILADYEDSKESVNDTYLSAWNSIPPHEPDNLSAFLAKITRRISIDIFRKRTRQKRSQYSVALSEVGGLIPSDVGNPVQESEYKLLGSLIRDWLGKLPDETRYIFINRYYRLESIKTLADCYGMSESKVKSILHRARKGLKEHLKKENYSL